MDAMMFNQVTPRIKVLEKRLLDKAKLDRMIHAPSALDALKVLQETEYANLMTHVKRAEDYEAVLSLELQRVYKLLYGMTPIKEVVDVMSIKYDYHNAKVLVKAKILEKDFSHMLIDVGTEETSTLQGAIDGGYYRELRSFMCKALEEVFIDFEEKKDPQLIDIILDNYMLKEMIEISQYVDNSFLQNYVKAQIDIANIKALLRIKQQQKEKEFLQFVLVDGGNIESDKLMNLLNDPIENIPGKLFATNYVNMLKHAIEYYQNNGSLHSFDKLSDDYIMGMMKNTKYIAFGVEPLIAYLYAKETEIKVIRIIMVGKLNDVSAEVITERLRETYE